LPPFEFDPRLTPSKTWVCTSIVSESRVQRIPALITFTGAFE
jgi:hypothetical protein